MTWFALFEDNCRFFRVKRPKEECHQREHMFFLKRNDYIERIIICEICLFISIHTSYWLS
jgi:hypothetical protein